jgi:TM2 domain-containing membrane protein YozV
LLIRVQHEELAMSDSDLEFIDRARPPSPGVAAVLSVLLPGLGQVYAGRLVAGALWFFVTGFAYWAILLPGFVAHALCIWSAYASARDWTEY